MPNGRRRATLSALTCTVLLLGGCAQPAGDAPSGSPAPPSRSASPPPTDAVPPRSSDPPSGTDAPPPDASAPTDAPVALPGLPTVDRARTALAGLTVAEPGSMDGYRRSAFAHWIAQGEGCDTREVVLERDGRGVRRDDDCRAVAGSWYSAFDGVRVADSSEVDVDHLVPLANAWRSGAHAWSDERRTAFANDLERPQLIAVSAASNRAKGDSAPDEWRPPRAAFGCVYGRAWTAVKAAYELTVTEAEQHALTSMLDSCPG